MSGEITNHVFSIVNEIFQFGKDEKFSIVYFHFKIENNCIYLKGAHVHGKEPPSLEFIENHILKKFFSHWKKINFIDFQKDYLEGASHQPSYYGFNFEIFFLHNKYDDTNSLPGYSSGSLSVTNISEMDLGGKYALWLENNT